MALYLFIMGVIAFFVGIVMTWEDFVSSLAGLRLLQTVFGVQPVSSDWVIYVMAITPWVGQVVFFGLWSLDTSRKWALAVSLGWFLLDFVSDVQHRSAGQFLPIGGGVNLTSSVGISAVMTFIYFTVGAELFTTAAFALTTTLFSPAARAAGRMWAGGRAAVREAKGEMSRASGHGQSQQRLPQQRPPQQQSQQRQRPAPPVNNMGHDQLASILRELEE